MGLDMLEIAKNEIKGIYSFLKRNYQEVAVICLATFFLTLDKYHPLSPQWLSSLIYFAILPLLTIVILLRKNPLDFGFRLGNWRVWGFHVILSLVIALPVLYLSSRFAELEGYYTVEGFDLLKYSFETIVYMFAWEFLYRGFMLFGLKGKLGEMSILVQMVPFVLLHFGKPEIETISTILVGIYLGYVAYRGESYWPAFIIHVVVNIWFRVIVNLL
jgi:hypothetical protein